MMTREVARDRRRDLQMDRHTPDENKIIEDQNGLVRHVHRRIMRHKIFVLDAGGRDRVSDRDNNPRRTTRHTNEGERTKEERREATLMNSKETSGEEDTTQQWRARLRETKRDNGTPDPTVVAGRFWGPNGRHVPK